MRIQRPQVLPARLERVRQRFGQWRRSRKGRASIPEGLWEAAVGASERYGLYRTARALGLDYVALKKHAREKVPQRVARAKGAPTFVEMLPMANAEGACASEVEMEPSSGGKIRLRLPGTRAVDLLAWVRPFWEGRG